MNEPTHIRPNLHPAKDDTGRLIEFPAICGYTLFGLNSVDPEFAPMFKGTLCPACAAGGELGQLSLDLVG